LELKFNPQIFLQKKHTPKATAFFDVNQNVPPWLLIDFPTGSAW